MALSGEDIRIIVRSEVRDAIRDMREMGKSAQSTGKQLESFARNASRVGKQLSLYVTAPLVAAGGAAIKFASDLEETQAKFNTVFADLADENRAWVEEFSDNVGRYAGDLEGFMAQFQDTFVPLGFARDEAAEFSQTLTQLTVDLASFNNVAESEVAASLASGIVGNNENFRRFGVIVNEARIQQELLNMGIRAGTDEVTEAQKAQARLNLVLQGTRDAQGDAVRTSESFANQMRALKAELKEAAVALGQELIPVALDLIAIVRPMIQNFGELTEQQKQFRLALVGIAAAAGPAVTAIGAVAKALIFLSAHPVVAAVAGITALTLAMAGLIKKFSEPWDIEENMEEAAMRLHSAVTIMGEDVRESVEGIAGSLELPIEKVAELAVQMGLAESAAEVMTLRMQSTDWESFVRQAEQRANYEQQVADRAQETLESQADITEELKEQIRLEQDRIKTVIERRIDAEERYENAVFSTQQLLNLGWIDQEEALQRELQATSDLIEELARIGYDGVAPANGQLEIGDQKLLDMIEKAEALNEAIASVSGSSTEVAKALSTGEAAAERLTRYQAEQKALVDEILQLLYDSEGTQGAELAWYEEQIEALREKLGLLRGIDNEQSSMVEKVAEHTDAIRTLAGAAFDVWNTAIDRERTRHDEYISHLNDELDAMRDRNEGHLEWLEQIGASEEEIEAARAQFAEDEKARQEEIDRKKYELEKKSFEREKRAAIAEIAINAAVGIVEHIANPFLAAAIGIAAAAQAGIVATQTFPGYATGGEFVTNGPQLVMVGDNPSGRERVRIDPMPDSRPRGGDGLVVQFSGNTFVGTGGIDEVARQIDKSLNRQRRVGVVR